MTDDFAQAPTDLPADLWSDTFDIDNPAQVWKKLGSEERAGIAKKIDLVGRLASAAKEAGFANFVSRAVEQIEDPQANNTVGAYYKVFDTFRRPVAAGGLGWTREQVAQHSIGRLKPLSNNREWCVANAERVTELLEARVESDKGQRLLTDSELRLAMNESLRAEKQGGEERKFANFTMSLPEAQAENLTLIVDAIKRKYPELEWSTNKALGLGQAVAEIFEEWLGFTDADGFSNAEYVVMPAEAIAADSTPELGAEEFQAALFAEGEEALEAELDEQAKENDLYADDWINSANSDGLVDDGSMGDDEDDDGEDNTEF